MIMIVEESKEVKGFSSKKMPYNKGETKHFPILPPFPCETKKVVALSEQWIKVNHIYLPEVEPFPSEGGLKDLKLFFSQEERTLAGAVFPLEESLTRNTTRRNFVPRRRGQHQQPSISEA